MRPRALILAQGGARRWDNYMGIPKTLVEIDGEALVHRAARLFTERGMEVVVVGDDDRLINGNARLVTLDDPWVVPSDMAKFIGTADLWATDARTVILWGDCFYTDAAADIIAFHNRYQLEYFRRPWPSKVTGKRWDESFGVSFGPDEHYRVLGAAWEVHRRWEAGELAPRDGTHCPVWEHYAVAYGLPNDVSQMIDTPGQTVIDDFTDDIDSPGDYHTWLERWEAAKGGLR